MNFMRRMHGESYSGARQLLANRLPTTMSQLRHVEVFDMTSKAAVEQCLEMNYVLGQSSVSSAW